MWYQFPTVIECEVLITGLAFVLNRKIEEVTSIQNGYGLFHEDTINRWVESRTEGFIQHSIVKSPVPNVQFVEAGDSR